MRIPRPQLKSSTFYVVCLFFFLSFSLSAQDGDYRSSEPVGLLLTWQQDPSTTMTIDWHTEGSSNAATLYFRMRGTEEWQTVPGDSHPFPFSDRMIHRVELTSLSPAATYEFHFGDASKAYNFKTMPLDANKPIRFAAGGDIQHDGAKEWFEQTNRQVVQYDPLFVVFGGDLAYGNGQEKNINRWYDWFDALMNTLLTEDRRVIPVLVTTGNHEVRGGYYSNDGHKSREGFPPYTGDEASRARIAPYFFELFAMPGQPGYNVLDFGDYMSIVLLDSDHTGPIEGEQTEWLQSVLDERTHVPHVIPVYHVPGYPTRRSFNDDTMRRIRENWVPLFEKHRVRVAFENHDHTYKRTYPLRNNEISSNGIVYIGDGAWGVRTRDVLPADDGKPRWYLDQTKNSVRHFIIGTIQGLQQHFLMIDENGNIIDEYPQTPRHSVEDSIEAASLN